MIVLGLIPALRQHLVIAVPVPPRRRLWKLLCAWAPLTVRSGPDVDERRGVGERMVADEVIAAWGWVRW